MNWISISIAKQIEFSPQKQKENDFVAEIFFAFKFQI